MTTRAPQVGDFILTPQEMEAALTAERRATVDRIRRRALSLRKRWGAEGLPASLEQILREVEGPSSHTVRCTEPDCQNEGHFSGRDLHMVAILDEEAKP